MAIAGVSQMQGFVPDGFGDGGPFASMGSDVDHAEMTMAQVTNRGHSQLAARASAGCRGREARLISRTSNASHLLTPGGVTEAKNVVQVATSETVQFGRHQSLRLLLFAAGFGLLPHQR